MSEHLGDLLSALADGQLDPADAKAAADHVLACPACAADLAATRQIRTLVRSLPPVTPLRPLVAEAPAPVPARPGRLAGLIAAVAAALALFVLPGVEQDPVSATQVDSLVQVHSTAPVNVDPMSQLAPSALPVSVTP